LLWMLEIMSCMCDLPAKWAALLMAESCTQ
jgi:hypothetical protein